MKTTEGEQDEGDALGDKLTCVCHLVLSVKGRQRKPSARAQSMCKEAPRVEERNTRREKDAKHRERGAEHDTYTCAHRNQTKMF